MTGFLDKATWEGEHPLIDDPTGVMPTVMRDDSAMDVDAGIESDGCELEVEVMFDHRYDRLHSTLMQAFDQASAGKGEERHGCGEPYENQISARINREYRGYALGQALKKIDESRRLSKAAAIRELQGAINLIALEIITLQDEGE